MVSAFRTESLAGIGRQAIQTAMIQREYYCHHSTKAARKESPMLKSRHNAF